MYDIIFLDEEAVKIIQERRGTQFDPDIVDVFVENQAEFDNVFNITMNSGDLAGAG